MAERSFKKEVEKLRLGAGEEFRGEGILAVTKALLEELGGPLVSSTLLLPGQADPMTQGWEINEELGDTVDAVLDSGDCGTEPSTVIDFSQDEPEIVRRGAGDPSDFE